MKLTKNHIGGLYTVSHSDGSWVYQLMDIKKGWLLFYTFHFPDSYYKEPYGKYSDWVEYEPQLWWDKSRLKFGWMTAKDK